MIVLNRVLYFFIRNKNEENCIITSNCILCCRGGDSFAGGVAGNETGNARNAVIAGKKLLLKGRLRH